MEQVEGIEPSSSAWKADVLAVVRHLHNNGAGEGTRTPNLLITSQEHHHCATPANNKQLNGLLVSEAPNEKGGSSLRYLSIF